MVRFVSVEYIALVWLCSRICHVIAAYKRKCITFVLRKNHTNDIFNLLIKVCSMMIRSTTFRICIFVSCVDGMAARWYLLIIHFYYSFAFEREFDVVFSPPLKHPTAVKYKHFSIFMTLTSSIEFVQFDF